jgi:hypothetical protein
MYKDKNLVLKFQKLLQKKLAKRKQKMEQRAKKFQEYEKSLASKIKKRQMGRKSFLKHRLVELENNLVAMQKRHEASNPAVINQGLQLKARLFALLAKQIFSTMAATDPLAESNAFNLNKSESAQQMQLHETYPVLQLKTRTFKQFLLQGSLPTLSCTYKLSLNVCIRYMNNTLDVFNVLRVLNNCTRCTRCIYFHFLLSP